MSRLIKVATIQHACTEQVPENMDTTETLIESAADEGADVVLLSELHTRLYIGQDNHPSYFDWAETIPGPTSDQLQQWADTYNVVIVGSVFENRGKGVYHNTCVVANDDGSHRAQMGCQSAFQLCDRLLINQIGRAPRRGIRLRLRRRVRRRST